MRLEVGDPRQDVGSGLGLVDEDELEILIEPCDVQWPVFLHMVTE